MDVHRHRNAGKCPYSTGTRAVGVAFVLTAAPCANERQLPNATHRATLRSMGTQRIVKGQNLPLDPTVRNLRMTVRWADSGPADVDLVVLLIGEDRRVRSDADMVFYNQTATTDGSVVHTGKTRGNGTIADSVSVDLSLMTDDVHGVTVAASTDGIAFGEIPALEWTAFSESGEQLMRFEVGDLTTETALVLGELYRRDGSWRLRAIGQGWAGGLAELAKDYGVRLEASDGHHEADAEPDEEFEITEPVAFPSGDQEVPEVDVEPVEPRRASSSDGEPIELVTDESPSTGPQVPTASPILDSVRRPRRLKVAVRTEWVSASVPLMILADDPTWQVSRLFSISGIGGTDEQEKRATSALLWAMAAVRPLGRALTARAAAPAGAVETFIEVGFPLGEQRVIPDGVMRISRGGRVWTALVEVKTGDAELQRDQIASYVRLARRRGFDVVMTISNEISPDPDRHPVDLPIHAMKGVALLHISWAEVMHEIRMLLAHHRFSDPLPMWILSELLRYLENPRSGAMSFHDMGPAWVAVRESVAAGTLRPADRKTAPVIEAWYRLVRQLGLGLTARLGVSVRQVVPRRFASDPYLRLADAAERLAKEGVLSATFRVPDSAGPITVTADLRTTQIHTSIDVPAPQEGSLRSRVTWLSRQLKSAPDDVLIEARFAPRPETTCERLADIRDRPSVLIPNREWEPSAFVISRHHPMGTKRSGVKGSFVTSVNTALNDFYADVIEKVRPWTPPVPQLQSQSAAGESGQEVDPELAAVLSDAERLALAD